MPSPLNHETISTQLIDWRQIAQQKALALAGCAEASVYEAESMRYSLLLEFINQQAEQIRAMHERDAQMLHQINAPIRRRGL